MRYLLTCRKRLSSPAPALSRHRRGDAAPACIADLGSGGRQRSARSKSLPRIKLLLSFSCHDSIPGTLGSRVRGGGAAVLKKSFCLLALGAFCLACAGCASPGPAVPS